MRRVLWVLVLGSWALASPVEALEYRLQVSNLQDGAFAHFLEGRIGRGEGELALTRLERSLQAGQVPAGVLLYDRTVQGAHEGLARAFGAAKARGSVRAAEDWRLPEEVLWEGTPGERSLWVIAPSTVHYQEVVHLALGTRGALRYHIPYGASGDRRPAATVAFPLLFLQFYAERGTLWERYLRDAVSLREGIAVVVGVNQNESFGDWVYVLVEHPAEPTTFKVVVGWRGRPKSQELGPPFFPER